MECRVKSINMLLRQIYKIKFSALAMDDGKFSLIIKINGGRSHYFISRINFIYIHINESVYAKIFNIPSTL